MSNLVKQELENLDEYKEFEFINNLLKDINKENLKLLYENFNQHKITKYNNFLYRIRFFYNNLNLKNFINNFYENIKKQKNFIYFLIINETFYTNNNNIIKDFYNNNYFLDNNYINTYIEYLISLYIIYGFYKNIKKNREVLKLFENHFEKIYKDINYYFFSIEKINKRNDPKSIIKKYIYFNLNFDINFIYSEEIMNIEEELYNIKYNKQKMILKRKFNDEKLNEEFLNLINKRIKF